MGDRLLAAIIGLCSGVVSSLTLARVRNQRVDTRLTWLESAMAALLRHTVVQASEAQNSGALLELMSVLAKAPAVQS